MCGRPSKSRSIIASWFFRTRVAIYCKQIAQEMILDYYIADSDDKSTSSEFGFPLCLKPYVSELLRTFSTECLRRKSLINSRPSNDTSFPYNNYTDDDNSTKQTTKQAHAKQTSPKSRRRKQPQQPKKSPPYSTHSYSTRYCNTIITKFLQSTSHSKQQIKYPDYRHQPGDPPKFTTPARWSLIMPHSK